MKKSLIALAVLSTIAGSVAAQSSVTVYGRLDVGYTDLSTTTSAGVKTDTAQVNQGVFTTSRFGLMGTEDLGGGVKASFMLEGPIALSNGIASSTDGNSFAFGRQAHVTLSSASMGSLRVGKTDALVKESFDSFDAGYANNLAGAYDGMGTNAKDISTSNIIGNRRDQVIRYISPTFSNTNVSVGLIKNSVDSTTSGAATSGAVTENNTGYELGANYKVAKLALSAAYRSADSKTNATAATTGTAGYCTTNAAGGDLVAVAAGSACTSPAVRVTGADVVPLVAATDTTQNDMAFGASYNFGPVVGYAQYFDSETKTNTNGSKVTEDAMAIGVRIPLGKTTLFASYTDGEQTAAAGTKTDFDGMQLGLKYDLSKRTYGYVAYGEAEKQQVGSAKAKSEALALGFVHSF